MKKRGFLLAEEALKLILAVISIGILAYLLYSLYNANTSSKNLDFAKESLSSISEGINAQAAEIQIYNPSGWYIQSWTKENLPLFCSNLGWEQCICICKKNGVDSCNSDGACLENPNGFSLADSVKIEDPPVTLSVNYQTKEVSKK